jgi:hypothetical protein
MRMENTARRHSARQAVYAPITPKSACYLTAIVFVSLVPFALLQENGAEQPLTKSSRRNLGIDFQAAPAQIA